MIQYSSSLDVSGIITAIADKSIRGQWKKAYLRHDQTSYQDVINLTGKGKLYCIFYIPEAGVCLPSIRLHIDGISSRDKQFLSEGSKNYCLFPICYGSDVFELDSLDTLTAAEHKYFPLNMEFNISMRVEFKNDAAQNTGVMVLYSED